MASKNNSATVLVTDDDDSIRSLLEYSLRRAGFTVLSTDNNETALNLIKNRGVDLVLQDIKMPDRDGVVQLQKIREINKGLPVIIMTAYSDWNSAVETCKQGAFAYVRKPFDIDKDIVDTVKRALNIGDPESHSEINTALRKIGFVPSQSPQMKKIIDMVYRIAAINAPCLITGESGVGKELFARALHYLSPRSSKQFVAINFAAIPANLLESELFGYKQGAFTDATADKKGLVDVTNEGTMFLDEIGEMPVALQVKLLRLLENSEYLRLGDTQISKSDIRFIAATNIDLKEEIKKGKFREDLFYRINVISLQIPPLRERKDDIPILAEYFLDKYRDQFNKKVTGFTPAAHQILQQYPWYGNIRELENVIQSVLALTNNDKIDTDDLSLLKAQVTTLPEDESELKEGFKLDEEVSKIERKYITTALRKAKGNHTKASKMLGMSLSSFRYKAQKYGLI